MTKMISLSTMALGFSTTAALAHGDHGGDLAHVVYHLLSEPDHLAMLSVVAGVAFMIFKVSRRKV